MLELKEFETLKDKNNQRLGYFSEDSTYLVPDLVSKTHIQNHLLFDQEYDFLEEDNVLRVTEFWGKMVFQICPELNLVSSTFVKSLLAQWLKDEDIEWLRAPGSVNQLFKYMEQLLPIISQVNDWEILAQWFKDHPQSYLRWGGWLEVSHKYWLKLSEEKILPNTWVSAYLVDHPATRDFYWERKIVFDLSCDINLIESELIKILSQNNEVHVLAPQPKWSDEYNSSLLAYLNLKNLSLYSDSKITSEIEVRFPHVKAVQFKKYTTMIAEVKSVTHQVRKWIDQGVAMDKIAVLAPDIEVFWKAFYFYSQQESFPICKNLVINSFLKPSVSCWLSTLRIRSGNLSFGDLELSEYRRSSSKNILSYDKFCQIFRFLYNHEDLSRDEEMKKNYAQDYDSNDSLTRDQFIIWALKYWEVGEPIENVEKLFHQIFLEIPSYVELDLIHWMTYLEQVVSKIEENIEASDTGVHFTNIGSSENLSVSHVCIIGLTESALRPIDSTSISFSDVMSLSEETGYNLDISDKTQLEFIIRWLASRDLEELFFMTSTTDFNAKIEAPATLWIRGAMACGLDLEAYSPPGLSRWDEIQRSTPEVISSERGLDEEHFSRMMTQLNQDWGREEIKNLNAAVEFSLSATQLEKYAKCPFKFFSEKILHLNELPEIDLDVDRMTRGQLVHLIFETLTALPMRFDYNEAELDGVLNEIFKTSQLILADERLWESLKPKFIILAQRFLEFEKKWREEYPETQTVARELPVTAYWDQKKKQLVSEKTKHKFRGFIDRIDSDGKGQYLVIDYKSTPSAAKHIGQWLKEDSFQMSLYAQALESNLTEFKDPKVTGSFYYVAKNFNREKGFRDKAFSNIYSTEGRSKNLVEREAIDELHVQINERISQLVSSMDEGTFGPSPKDDDYKICQTCKWRPLCRAPHLN